jgi:hypothetical protein
MTAVCSVTMRRILGTLTIGSAVVLAPACGGGVFTEATGADDGASDVGVSSDVLRSSDGTSSDGGPRDGGPSDGGAMDGSDVTTDGTGGDAPAMPDVIEEPPPHCGGAFTCAPIVPSGWTGPLELYAGSSAAPSCSASFTGPAFDGNAGLSVPGSKCDCQCQNAQGVQCSSPTISFFGSSAVCGAASYCAAITLTPSLCTAVDIRSRCVDAGLTISMAAQASTASGGSCPPVALKNVPPSSWATNARACLSSLGVAQSDCAPGSVCAPYPPPPFGAGLCIAQPGDVQCPASGYPVKQLFYGTVSDTRDCSTCTCGNVAGSSCSASIGVSQPSALPCSTGQISYLPPFMCDPVQQPSEFKLTLTPSGGSCTPSPVAPTGTATPAKPNTFCCTQ